MNFRDISASSATSLVIVEELLELLVEELLDKIHASNPQALKTNVDADANVVMTTGCLYRNATTPGLHDRGPTDGTSDKIKH
eukprot:scaffold225079_cov15-Prasinocladus_malaysianus.AAC.1